MDNEQQPPAVETTSEQPPTNYRELAHRASGKKKRLLILIPLLVLILAGAVIFYIFLVQIPNKPENVLKKAVVNFVKGGNYTISGRLDHGDGNAPDFEYEIKTNNKDFHLSVDSSTFMMGPNAEIMQVGGKKYVKFSDWMDSSELAKRYINAGQKGMQEHMAEFAEDSGVHANQNSWLQIDDFVFDTPARTGMTAPQTIEEAGVNIESFGSVEQLDGKKIRSYQIRLTKEGFSRLLDQITDSSVARAAFESYSEHNGFPGSIRLEIQVDIAAKAIHKMKYSGRPFRDATLSMELIPGSNHLDTPEEAPLVSQALDYGVVKTLLFNPDFQSADSAGDRERIADIKGIKMAMEIYRMKYGRYPDRSYPVTQKGQMMDEMKGADEAVFTDPTGKFVGMHGSQYVYVGEAADGNQSCGSTFFNPVTNQDTPAPGCSKFWVATTLDDGREYKQTSD